MRKLLRRLAPLAVVLGLVTEHGLHATTTEAASEVTLAMAVHEIAGTVTNPDGTISVILGAQIPCGGSTASDRVAFVGTATPPGAYLNAGVTYTDHQLSPKGGADWYDDGFRVRVRDSGVVAGPDPQDLQTVGLHTFQLRQLGGDKAVCQVNRVEGPAPAPEPSPEPSPEPTIEPSPSPSPSPSPTPRPCKRKRRCPRTTLVSNSVPNMASLRFEIVTYETKEPIPCGGETSVGRVRIWGFVTMNAEAHWDRLFEYTDHQTASDGEPTWGNTYEILSQPGESQHQIAAQQINTWGEHTFRLSHVGDANHVHECTITRAITRS